MDVTKSLADFVVDTRYHDIPKDVVEKAGELLLDQFAAQLASSIKPWSKATLKYVRDLGTAGRTTASATPSAIAQHRHLDGIAGSPVRRDDVGQADALHGPRVDQHR